MNNQQHTDADYEALSLGCLSETAAKESYLAERNELAAQRDELAAALRKAVAVLEAVNAQKPFGQAGWEAIGVGRAALAKVSA